MASIMIKDKVLQEIDLIPEDKLTDVYHFLHTFRLDLEKTQTQEREQILAFAGCWQDMPDEIFADFIDEVAKRRKQAFTRRRGRESLAD